MKATHHVLFYLSRREVVIVTNEDLWPELKMGASYARACWCAEEAELCARDLYPALFCEFEELYP